MQLDPASRRQALQSLAPDYLDLSVRNITREFPVYPWYIATKPGRYPTHREAHPVFFGSFDWHSCVEMYWVALRILRHVPEITNAHLAIDTLDQLITPHGMATEQAFFLDPDLGSFERPYGWGWYLMLAAETHLPGSPGQRWAPLLDPLASTLEHRLLDWLPKLTYPQRTGLHPNTAFALELSRPWAMLRAAQGDSRLQDAIEIAALRFFLHDVDYPAHYEPSGADFLSPALTEAVLMSRVLDATEFRPWLEAFLPRLPEEPRALLRPAIVSDPTDGQLAHLHGLNLSRAWAWMVLSGHLEADDPRRETIVASAERHAATSLGLVVGSHYALEHWLAAYAMLLLTFDDP